MRTLQILKDSYPEIGGRYGSVVIPTDDEIQLASISLPDGSPAIRYWLEASADWVGLGPDGQSWYDRSNGRFLTALGGVFPSLQAGVVGTAQGLVLSGTEYLGIPDGMPLNPSACTILASVHAEGTGNANSLIGRLDSAAQPPSLFMNTTRLGSAWGNGSTQLIHAANDYIGRAHVVGMTFGTQRGQSLRRNGAEVARDATAITPPDTSNVRVGWWGNPNQFVGKIRRIMIVDADMSDPVYGLQLRYMEDLMMAECGIARGS